MKKSKKILIALMCATPIVGIGITSIVVNAQYNNLVVAHGEEVSSSDITSDSEVTSDSEKTWLDSINDTINNFKDTYLTPLIGGVSIVAVLQSILSIAVAISNFKNNSKTKENMQECKTNVDNVTSLSTDLKASVEKIIDELKTQNQIASLNKQELKNATDKMLLEMERITNYTQDFSEVKESIKALASIIVKLALLEDDVIKSGIGEEIKQLEDFINRP